MKGCGCTLNDCRIKASYLGHCTSFDVRTTVLLRCPFKWVLLKSLLFQDQGLQHMFLADISLQTNKQNGH